MASVRLTRSERAQETRRALLDAAREVFLREGFHGASLDAVAAEAGFTKGAVYSRFENKADLFLALLERRVDERAATLRSMAPTGTLAGDAAAINREWLRGARDRLDWVLLVIEFRVHVARHPELHERYAQVQERLRSGITEVLERNAGPLPAPHGLRPDDVARAEIAISNALALEEAIDGDPQALETMHDVLTAAIVREMTQGGSR